ncbi:MAG TPA: hypothetical protein VKF80_09115 [Candidatus Eisenbacteria bacterium]|nr:hypothetical protein [Candidatus Eisenbacteria bacterium]
MGRYPEADLSQLRLISVAERPTKVSVKDFARPSVDGMEAEALLARMPKQLGAERLREAVQAIVAARAKGRPVVVLAGAHVIKVGASPYLAAWIERGIVTHLALHGAGAIHDVEIALFGGTSEDVEEHLHRGTFGLVRETGDFFFAAARAARERGEGLGEALGRKLDEARAPHAAQSLLAVAWRAGVPATVHVALGTDTVHALPSADGASVGEATLRDFRILAHTLGEARGAVVLNLGSAVILPEVFLKALTVAVNLGASLEGLTTVSLDQIRHYRPRVNVLERPTRAPGAKGLELVGQHEIVLPLLGEAVLAAWARAGTPIAKL